MAMGISVALDPCTIDRTRSLEGDTILRALEEASPVGLAAIGVDGVQTYVNRAFCAMVGFDEGEFGEAGFAEHLVKPVDLDEIARLLRGDPG